MSSTRQAVRLPALNEFAPTPLGGPQALFELLDLVAATSTRAVVVEQIRERWFSQHAQRTDPAERLKMQSKLAGNVISGMRQVGLLEAGRNELSLSETARSLADLNTQDGPQAALEAFARHLLRNYSGIEILEAARFVRRRDGAVSNATLLAQLRDYGFNIATNSVNHGRVRDWIAAASVVDEHWNIDEARFEEVSGVSLEGIAGWSALTSLQQDALITLRVRAESDLTPITSRDLIELFRLRGLVFVEAQTRRDIYAPLTQQGWIHHEGSGTGRGGNGGTITLTDKALSLDIEKIEDLKLGLVPPDLREKLGTSVEDIFEELSVDDKNIKGLALELLALKLVAEAGLFPVELRKRGIETGGAEVDLLAEGAHLHFSRWLIQCKNVASTVSVEVLAKELGMAALLRAQVVVILSTGGFSRTVLELSREAAASTAIQVILLGPNELNAYRTGRAAALRSELHNQALLALSLKQTQRLVPKE